MKMSRFATGFTSVMCLFMILTGSSSALFRRPSPPTIQPTDPNDLKHEENTLQTVPYPDGTAKGLINSLLGFSQTADRIKRRIITEDIVILIDGSGSVSSCEFMKGKEALELVIRSTLHVPGYDVKYAAITFGSTASVNFKFLPNSMAAREITKISYPGGGTNTEVGLAEAKKLFDDPYSGRRSFSTRKIVLLFTDGDLTIPSANANALKASGVEIYVVAFGSYINGIDEIVKVSSYPPDQYLFRMRNNQGLLDIIKLIVNQVSSGYNIVNYDTPC